MFKNKAVIWIGCIAIALAAFNLHQDNGSATAKARAGKDPVPAEVAVFGASKSPILPSTTLTGPRRVVIIGDSLTEGSAPYLPETPGYVWQVDARVGRPLLNVGSLVSKYEPTADAFVIALGTNDCMSSVTDKVLERRIFTVLGKVLGAPTAFVTIGEHGPIASCAARYNRLVREIAGAVPRVYVLDWQAQVSQHPEWYGATGDGIHLTLTGYKARAEWMSSAFSQHK